MRGRIELLERHGLTMPLIAEVIAELTPMAGAADFLDELRRRTQVVILSDTFEQFAAPLMAQLGMPTILCHRLLVAEDRIVDYRLRMPDQKRHAVLAFQGLGYGVVAAGDSYNDTSMLTTADAGFLFRAPQRVRDEFAQLPAVDDYDDLLELVTSALAEIDAA